MLEEITKNSPDMKKLLRLHMRRYKAIEVIERLGWTRISLPPREAFSGYYIVGDHYVEQENWCKANIPNTKGRRWRTGPFGAEHEFYFENLEDALHFKVTWR